MTFRTPVRDMRFILDHAAGFSALEKTGAFPELTDDLVSAILEEMGKFCDGVIAPLNEKSDQDGARLENGVVRTSPGFKQAYAQGGKACRRRLPSRSSMRLTARACRSPSARH